MKLNCVIVDDEYLALRILAGFIKEIPGLELTGQFKLPEEAINFITDNHVDILFLDIQMPYINGIDFLKRLPYRPVVLFTTARHEYAVEAFELEVLDYLVKPISPERFEKAIEKAKQFLRYREYPEKIKTPSEYLNKGRSTGNADTTKRNNVY